MKKNKGIIFLLVIISLSIISLVIVFSIIGWNINRVFAIISCFIIMVVFSFSFFPFCDYYVSNNKKVIISNNSLYRHLMKMESAGFLLEFGLSFSNNKELFMKEKENNYTRNFELLYAMYKTGDLIKPKSFPLYSVFIPSLVSIEGLIMCLWQVLYFYNGSYSDLVILFSYFIVFSIITITFAFVKSFDISRDYIEANNAIELKMMCFEQKVNNEKQIDNSRSLSNDKRKPNQKKRSPQKKERINKI